MGLFVKSLLPSSAYFLFPYALGQLHVWQEGLYKHYSFPCLDPGAAGESS